MKKFILVLTGFLVSFIFGFTKVDAREYTQEDVQKSLAAIISKWQSTAPKGTSFDFSSYGNDLAVKSTFDGVEYVSHFIFNDGVFSFVSDRSSVTTEEEFIKSFYDSFNITFLLVSIMNMYDDETKESVKDVEINDSLTFETFTLERDGMKGILINSDMTKITLENGQVLEATGFIKSLDIDINHSHFIKFLIDNDGSLEFGSQKKIPTLNLKDITYDSITIEIGNTTTGRTCKVYKQESGKDFELLNTIPCSDSLIDDNLPSDTEYSYKVETDEGMASSVKSARTLKKDEPSTQPTVPVPSIKLSNIKMDSITVNFYNTGDAKTCTIYRATEDGTFENLKSVPCAESYVDKEVYANTKYSYKVEANGNISDPASVKTLSKVIEPAPSNPKTGILTYTLMIITLIISCVAGLQILGKNKLFKKL